MPTDRVKAAAEFRRAMTWIAILGVIVVIVVLIYLGWSGDLHLHMVIATIFGVFVSVLLGSGLFALAFFSDRSGHDDQVTRATRHEDTPRPELRPGSPDQ
jgi:ABC-type Fe3+-siderophore transport system permease subunit